MQNALPEFVRGMPAYQNGVACLYLYEARLEEVNCLRPMCEHCLKDLRLKPTHIKANVQSFCNIDCMAIAFVQGKVCAVPEFPANHDNSTA